MCIRVVVVENRPLIQQAILAQMKQKSGIEAVVAPIEEETLLRFLRAQQPNLIVFSTQLWMTHPTATVEKFRATCPNAKLLVLVSQEWIALTRRFIEAEVEGCLFYTDDDTSRLDTVVDDIVKGSRIIHSFDVLEKHRDQPHIELSPRDLRILRLIAEAYTNESIARQLGLSAKTVGNLAYQIYPEIGLEEDKEKNIRVRAAVKVRELGLLKD